MECGKKKKIKTKLWARDEDRYDGEVRNVAG